MGTATDGRRRDLARVGETLVVAAEKNKSLSEFFLTEALFRSGLPNPPENRVR